MMVNRHAPVNIAFSGSRNAALIERKLLQYTSLSMKYNHCTMSEIKNRKFHNVRRPCLCLSTLRGSETTLKPGFLTKSVFSTMQTCVDVANEHLPAYNTGAGAKINFFVVCINVDVQGIQSFCLHLFSLTNISEKNQSFYIDIGQNIIRERQRKGFEAVGSANVQQGGSRRNRK